ncbi:MAG: phosphate ABC transporter substrate-binding protein PstS [Oligoflexia bacterium]|nr:phosphate ABC transporter substrate-binding protein PstS [Oligoflexia bacterium]
MITMVMTFPSSSFLFIRNDLCRHLEKIILISLLSIYILAQGGLSSSYANTIIINGAGATFPYPIYMKWISEYQKQNPRAQINYQPLGSSGGIRQLLKQTVDFAASDIPMKESELHSAPWPIIQIPTVIGAVAVIYNLAEVKTLRLDGITLSKIFSGKIRMWNDPEIKKLNPGAPLPNKEIVSVHRSDGSGTTEIFTSYLSLMDSGWKSVIGSGKAVSWSSGIGAKGNDGISGIIKQTPDTIGYVELAYAINNRLMTASLKNASGDFVAPTVENVILAASGIKVLSGDLSKINILNQPGKNAYPISSFTYMLFPNIVNNQNKNQNQDQKIKLIREFLKWSLGNGQNIAASLHYAPLPKDLSSQLARSL